MQGDQFQFIKDCCDIKIAEQKRYAKQGTDSYPYDGIVDTSVYRFDAGKCPVDFFFGLH